MIKGGVGPDGRIVAQLARCRESSRGMGGIVCAGVVLLMARIAERAVQRVVVTDVAIGAKPRRDGVAACQLEARGGVIKDGVRPQHGVVAGLAGRREPGGDVIHRRGRVVVVGLVTRDARSIGDVVVIVDVAVGALSRRNGVTARQVKSGAVVVESRIQPGTRAVALVAGLREVRRDVVRVGRALVVLEMTCHAGRACQGVVVVDVTIHALPRRDGVQPSQRKASRRVVELAIGPQHSVVALLASRGESCVGNRSGGGVVVVLVATDAGSAGDAVVVVDVTVRALPRRNRVRPGQRKSRLGMVEGRRLPGGGVVTGLACLREAAGYVIWVRGALKVLQVARNASGAGQVVVVVDVAVGALPRRHGMSTSQCEIDHRVIEGRR